MLDRSNQLFLKSQTASEMVHRLARHAMRKSYPAWLFAIQEWRVAHGRFPRLFRPRTFNEKILHRILFDRRPILNRFADKLAVRGYVEERLGPEILPKLYHVTEDPFTIPFNDLPDKFVVKPSHGSGWVKIVRDKPQMDRQALLTLCRSWLKEDFYYEHREWGYKHVPPRILVEEFVDDGKPVPDDYKFFVFDGKVQFLNVDLDRFEGHKRQLLTRDWQKIEGSFGVAQKFSRPLARPVHLDAMVAAAEALGQGVDFVRADFYDTGKRIYFGELTMTPGCGHNRFEPETLDLRFGRLWKQRIR